MFRAAVADLEGALVVAAPIDEAFRLFSPEGETGWVAGWDPEWLCPASSDWVAGQVFRTRGENGDVVWIVAAMDLAAHRVVYHRVDPSQHVARVRWSARLREPTEPMLSFRIGSSASPTPATR